MKIDYPNRIKQQSDNPLVCLYLLPRKKIDDLVKNYGVEYSAKNMSIVKSHINNIKKELNENISKNI